jgi:hypothetical protein
MAVALWLILNHVIQLAVDYSKILLMTHGEYLHDVVSACVVEAIHTN